MEKRESLTRVPHYRCRRCGAISPLSDVICSNPRCAVQLGIYAETIIPADETIVQEPVTTGHDNHQQKKTARREKKEKKQAKKAEKRQKKENKLLERAAKQRKKAEKKQKKADRLLKKAQRSRSASRGLNIFLIILLLLILAAIVYVVLFGLPFLPGNGSIISDGPKDPVLSGTEPAATTSAPVETTLPAEEVSTEPQPEPTEEIVLWHNNAMREDPCYLNLGDTETVFQVFGTELCRHEVRSVTFLDSLDGAPGDAVDISESRNGSVLLWWEPSGDLYDMYIAGHDGVNGMNACHGLFAGYRNLQEVNFNGNFHTELTESFANMFFGCIALKQVALESLDSTSVTDMTSMFFWTGLETVDLSSFNTANVTKMYAMFAYSTDIHKIVFGDIDTSKVKDMGFMFYDCYALADVDIENLDTAAVQDMQAMFFCCESLTQLDLSTFQTARVGSMHAMFRGCSGLEHLNIGSFDTRCVADMSQMFYGCSALRELNVESFDTSNVTTMQCMFQDCKGLTELYLSNFETHNVTDMSYMFYGCALTLNYSSSNFDTSKVTNYENFSSESEENWMFFFS